MQDHAGGDGYYTQIDPRNPNVRYAESQQGIAGRVDLATGRIKYLRPVTKEGEQRLRFNWNSPMALSKHDPDIVYLGGNRLFRIHAPDGASEAISPDLSSRDLEKIVTEVVANLHFHVPFPSHLSGFDPLHTPHSRI